MWDGAVLGVLVDEVTATVREHITLEREVTNYWIAKYFEQELARDPNKTWTALLLHWVRQASPCTDSMPAGMPPPVSLQLHEGRLLRPLQNALPQAHPNASQ